MNLLGKYKNGNYQVTILDDGTKIRENDLDFFEADFPENMDVKITDYCDRNCAMCHEGSSTEGKHGDILNVDFINTLVPYTEMAIGGGNPTDHPDLEKFLIKLKERKCIPNMTIHQEHFLRDFEFIKRLQNEKLLYGIGVSLTNPTDELISKIKELKNVVIHVINGIVTKEQLKKIKNKDLKILILGYKLFRKGIDFYSEDVENKKEMLFNELEELVGKFNVISFDNKALEQLQVKRLLSEEEWEEFYMGADSSHTMYVDLVQRKFAGCSTSTERYKVDEYNNIIDIFSKIKNTIKEDL